MRGYVGEVRRAGDSRQFSGHDILTTPLLPGLELPLPQICSEDM